MLAVVVAVAALAFPGGALAKKAASVQAGAAVVDGTGDPVTNSSDPPVVT
jgi:hypothetical protein